MIELLIITGCLIINALLAGAETAFIAVSRPTLKGLMKKGDEKARLLFYLRENPEKTLSIIQVGITFVGALAAAVGGAGAEESITPWLMRKLGIHETIAEFIAMLIIVIPLTYVSVVFGELIPKTVALKRPLFIASQSAPWLQLLSRLISPIVTLLEKSTKFFTHLFPQKHITSEDHTNEENSIELDVLPAPNRQYVLNIVKIEKTLVKDILVNWSEVVYVNDHQTIEQVEETIIASGHTRLPVLKNQEVMGMINAKEFLAFQKTQHEDWLRLIRPVVKISDQLPILFALQMMQEKKAHLAIVYHETIKLGIVTMEDIFEEMIGDIYDEDDDGSLKKILNSLHFKRY